MTTPSELEVRSARDGVRFGVKAQPRAKREGIVGLWNGCVRVAVREPAESGRANDAITAVLARALGVRAAAVALVSGAASPRKIFVASGLAAGDVRARLLAALADGGAV